MSIKQDGIIQIPGVPFGFKWDAMCWVLYRSEVVKNKTTGRKRLAWCKPLYPVSFAHMAQIVTRECGKEAKDAQKFLQALISERERLEAVLERMVVTANASVAEQGNK